MLRFSLFRYYRRPGRRRADEWVTSRCAAAPEFAARRRDGHEWPSEPPIASFDAASTKRRGFHTLARLMLTRAPLSSVAQLPPRCASIYCEGASEAHHTSRYFDYRSSMPPPEELKGLRCFRFRHPALTYYIAMPVPPPWLFSFRGLSAFIWIQLH